MKDIKCYLYSPHTIDLFWCYSLLFFECNNNKTQITFKIYYFSFSLVFRRQLSKDCFIILTKSKKNKHEVVLTLKLVRLPVFHMFKYQIHPK